MAFSKLSFVAAALAMLAQTITAAAAPQSTTPAVPVRPGPDLPRCNPTKTVTVVLRRTTIKIPPCPTLPPPPSTITPQPTPPITTIDPVEGPTHCPHYCLRTTTVLPTEPWKCPPIIGGCDAIVFVTKTSYCSWCPTMSCGTVRTVTEQYKCPETFICPEYRTEYVPCTVKSWPTGYKLTVG